MKYRIRRLSHHGTTFSQPCEGATPVGKISKSGFASGWEIDVDDIRLLSAKEGSLIVEKNGMVIIYDDYME